jgi:Tfp pilus assembly protein PilW
MKIPHRHRQSGYTLMELLMYVSVVGGLLVAVMVFFGIVADARIKSQSTALVNEQASTAMETITSTIHNATSITSPTAGASNSSLTLVVPTGALSPTIFNLSGTILQIKEGAAAAVPLTSSDVQVTSLTFKNLTRAGTSGLVQVIITMKRTNPDNRSEYDYQKTFTSSAEVSW